jgi:hypothetical protein
MRLGLIVSIVLVGIIGSAFCCPGDRYCRACEVNNNGVPVCTSCQNSFLDKDTGKCDPNIGPKINNCIQYKKNKKGIICEACEWGYRYDYASGTCMKCEVKGCAFCPLKICLGCLNGLRLDNKNECDPNFKYQDVNCNISRSTFQLICLECNNGFIMNNDDSTCIALNGFENCDQVKSKNSPNCQICRVGYYVALNGSCKSILEVNEAIAKEGAQAPIIFNGLYEEKEASAEVVILV